MDHPKVGLVLSSDYLNPHKLIELSPLIDQLGYHQISVPEIWGYDAISLLSILATTTKKVRLATGIINIYSRTPAMMAMTAASLDKISNGRMTLGIGVSGPAVIENLHGQKFTKPLKRTREYISILRTLFDNKRLNHETTQLGNLKNFKLSIKDINSDIPIHIASLGPKNMELTAELADGWIPVIMPLEAFKLEVGKIKGHLKKYNKSIDNFEITPFVLALIGDEPEKIALIKGHLAYYFGGMGTFYNNMLKRMGFVEEADSVMDLWKRGEIAEAANSISDEILAKICIYGPKEEAQERLINFIKAGATTPLLSLPFKSKLEHAMETFQTLAPANLSI